MPSDGLQRQEKLVECLKNAYEIIASSDLFFQATCLTLEELREPPILETVLR